jgi:hypothetical protein
MIGINGKITKQIQAFAKTIRKTESSTEINNGQTEQIDAKHDYFFKTEVKRRKTEVRGRK